MKHLRLHVGKGFVSPQQVLGYTCQGRSAADVNYPGTQSSLLAFWEKKNAWKGLQLLWSFLKLQREVFKLLKEYSGCVCLISIAEIR